MDHTSMFRRTFARTIRVVSITALAAMGAGWIVPAATASASPDKTKAKSYESAYYAYPDSVTSVQATITLPTYSCKKGDNLAPGDGDYDNTNAAWSGPYIYMGCTKSGKTYVPSYGGTGLDVDGSYTYPSLAMHAGDNVEFTTSCGPSGTVVTIEDLNSSLSVSASSPNPSSCTSAYAGDVGVIGKGPGGQTKLPTFGAIDYSDVTVNGSPIGTFSPVADNYYEGKKNVITTGPITDGGTAFATTQSA
jgi:hypothetical protein